MEIADFQQILHFNKHTIIYKSSFSAHLLFTLCTHFDFVSATKPKKSDKQIITINHFGEGFNTIIVKAWNSVERIAEACDKLIGENEARNKTIPCSTSDRPTFRRWRDYSISILQNNK